jgi:hypothetical protein
MPNPAHAKKIATSRIGLCFIARTAKIAVNLETLPTMKKTLRLFTLTLGVLAVGTFTSLADENDKAPEATAPEAKTPRAERGQGGERRGPGARRELTEEQKAEMAKRREAMMAARKEADLNGDGKIEGADEEAKMLELAKLVMFDKNGDKKITEEGDGAENVAAAEKFKGLRGRGQGAPGQGRRGGQRGGQRGGGAPQS